MRKNNKKFNKGLVWFSVLFSVCLVMLPFIAKAASASLYLSPSTGTYTVGNTFSVVAKVNTGGSAINTAQGTLVFDTNAFEVQGVSKSGSIFTLWTQEPGYSNSAGTVDFGGGVPNPGFTGSSGTIITVTLKVKTNGMGNITWSSGAVLANDGLGTNILSSMGGGNYTLSPSVSIPAPTPPPTVPSVGVPAPPAVSSSTHSDPDKWHNNNDPAFKWTLPSGVTGVSLMLTTKPKSDPGSLSDGLLSNQAFQNIKDGEWYFHIKFKNKNGWGQITHRKVLIDTEVPSAFEIKVDNEGDPTNPQPLLLFESEDKVSGIDYYEIKIDNDEPVKVTSEDMQDDPYKMPIQLPDKHNVLVRAVDKAGNFALAGADVIIEPLEKPIITEYPKKVSLGEPLVIKGTSSYPNTKARIFVQEEDEEPSFRDTGVDEQGNWEYTHDKSLKKAVYNIWAQAIDERGATSYPTDKISIMVGLPPLLKWGKVGLDYLSIVITLLAIIAAAVVGVIYGWHRLTLWKKRLRKEVREAEESISKAFKALYESIQEQFEILEDVKSKRQLTKEEKRILKQIREDLDVAEKYVEKEMKDVEKELE